MAITSSSSSRKWERPAACSAGCFPLLLPLSFCRGCGEPFLLTLIPSQQHFSSCASLMDGVLPFQVPCFCVPLSSAPLCHLSVWWDRACKLHNRSTLCICVFFGVVYYFCWLLDPFVWSFGVWAGQRLTDKVRTLWGAPAALGQVAELLSGLLHFFSFFFFLKYLVCISNWLYWKKKTLVFQ